MSNYIQKLLQWGVTWLKKIKQKIINGTKVRRFMLDEISKKCSSFQTRCYLSCDVSQNYDKLNENFYLILFVKLDIMFENNTFDCSKLKLWYVSW